MLFGMKLLSFFCNRLIRFSDLSVDGTDQIIRTKIEHNFYLKNQLFLFKVQTKLKLVYKLKIHNFFFLLSYIWNRF